MNFSNFYNIYQNRINNKLLNVLNNLPSQTSILIKSMKYGTLIGGKRLRACLVYTIGEMFKVNIVTLDVISISIELIHSYSLIHDDLPCIDNDYFRRGKLSCHIKYGENFAILAGDALQSLAFNILSTHVMPGVSNRKRLKIISELSYAIGCTGMCIGQALDLQKNTKELNITELEKIYLYKTAFLIRSSIRLSYLSSNFFSKEILLLLDRYAISIGLAFQIQDDIFDFNNDTKKLNKNHNIYNTYPYLIGIKKSQEKIQILHQEALSILKFFKKKHFIINKLKLLTDFIIKRSK
ncbi:(2E,6E)-farnesyl diphosphate synthase [Buchnera aphidicola (Aphis helianthi)]|uniref:(2E,6E)-farnesyl diphosphate synthase n=1 Tax=Buchnera aphidicola (Aphis helianthi) TaxID=2315802 RepID=A0A4D6XR19_9GAMM|nr:polyprenyl synthetase family protein [Buchnera aphidicola]QCI17268.1 (2E,6E)-farnesyl diphosphate synthase [Buchnera aphidicola (Aphis helianthi)]